MLRTAVSRRLCASLGRNHDGAKMRLIVIGIVAFAVGLAVAVVLSLGVAAVSGSFGLSRDDLITNDREALLNHVNAVRTWSLLGVCLSCAIGAVVASFVAARLAANAPILQYVAVSVILLLCAAQFALLPERPLWAAILAIVLAPLCVHVGRRLGAWGSRAA
jgi:hypothetical protein